MFKIHKFFLMLGALAMLFSTFALAASASAAPAANSKEVYQQFASINKAKVMSTGPGAVTIRVMGDYTCDKVRYKGYVSGKTIFIEAWDVKNKGNECNNSGKFARNLTFSKLVPGKYTILVNVNPETGKHQRAVKNVVIPVYPTPTPGAGQ